MKVRRLFTEADLAHAFNFGFAQGFVRTVPASDPKAVVELYRKWLDEKYPEGCEAELRGEVTQ